MLRRVPQFLRPESNCRGQHRAAKEMSANGFGKVQTTPRAEVRAAPAQDVYGKSRVVEADVTDWASDDDVVPAESEEQRPLLRRQAVRTSAVTMRQKAAIRLDDVGQRNRLRALGALCWHAAPRSSMGVSRPLVSPDHRRNRLRPGIIAIDGRGGATISLSCGLARGVQAKDKVIDFNAGRSGCRGLRQSLLSRLLGAFCLNSERACALYNKGVHEGVHGPPLFPALWVAVGARSVPKEQSPPNRTDTSSTGLRPVSCP